MSRSSCISKGLIETFLALQKQRVTPRWLREQAKYMSWWLTKLTPDKESGAGGPRWPLTGGSFPLRVSLALQGMRAQGARLAVLGRFCSWCVQSGRLQPWEHPLRDLPLSFFESPDAVAEGVAKWSNLRRRAVKAENTHTPSRVSRGKHPLGHPRVESPLPYPRATTGSL